MLPFITSRVGDQYVVSPSTSGGPYIWLAQYLSYIYYTDALDADLACLCFSYMYSVHFSLVVRK